MLRWLGVTFAGACVLRRDGLSFHVQKVIIADTRLGGNTSHTQQTHQEIPQSLKKSLGERNVRLYHMERRERVGVENADHYIRPVGHKTEG